MKPSVLLFHQCNSISQHQRLWQTYIFRKPSGAVFNLQEPIVTLFAIFAQSLKPKPSQSFTSVANTRNSKKKIFLRMAFRQNIVQYCPAWLIFYNLFVISNKGSGHEIKSPGYVNKNYFALTLYTPLMLWVNSKLCGHPVWRYSLSSDHHLWKWILSRSPLFTSPKFVDWSFSRQIESRHGYSPPLPSDIVIVLKLISK